MNSFLKQIAECYYKELGKDVGECCFVFPNRRSALFFRKYLGQSAGRPVLAPRLMSINDLFSELSGLQTAGTIPALDMLYRRYAALMWPDGEARESFDDFVFWGDTLLNDFGDVDKYLVNARDLFTNVDDLNRIDAGYSYLSEEQKAAIRIFWSNFLEDRIISKESDRLDKKGEFKTVWSILFDLYEGFRSDLKAQGKGYEGMIYREVAESLDDEASAGRLESLRRFRRIVFVGLNALNECEKRLLDALKKECDTDFYWDFYGPMVTDENNKSSLFLRENIERYPSRHIINPALAPSQTFRSIAVPSTVGQTRLACSLLGSIAAEKDFIAEETAVILPDENLLLPMLGAIPECIDDVNVTMGFPLSAGNVATFLRMLDRLHRNSRIKGDICQFYHRDVIALLTHPFVRRGIEGVADGIVAQIRKNNIVYSPEEVFAGDRLLAAIFRRVNDAAALPAYLRSIIGILQDSLEGLDKEFIYSLEKCLNSLTSYGLEIQPATFFKLLGRLAEVIRVQFNGEPLKGLQIMGPLETRALDFKNVIILSANEGSFPKRSVSASFIPYNLRKGFGLPTYEFQDAISSYHFYRSICRAERVILIRDSRSEGLNSGEESRYLKQLKFLYGVDLTEESASYEMGGECISLSAPTIEKGTEVMAKLEEKFLNGNGHFSASSLNAYLDCRLKFYYSKVLGVSETEEVTEGLDAGMFGSVFHKSMENIYKPFAGREVTAADIESIPPERICGIVDAAFLSECRMKEVTGRNLIVRELILKFIEKTLEVDASRAPFELVAVEHKGYFNLPVGDGREVTIEGVIDRIDRDKGATRIIDYKTGKVDKKGRLRPVQDLFSQDRHERPSIAFQMCIYVLLALKGEVSGKCSNYCTSVYALRDIFGGQPVEQEYEVSDLDEFKAQLQMLINEIFDPSVPFSPCAEGSSQCNYCDFRKLCNRWKDSK